MVKLDEGALRRPGFRDGTPVVFADSQTWHLPSPLIVPTRQGLRFHRPEGGKTRAVHAYDAGGDGDYGELLDRFMEAEFLADEWVALADLAFHLLTLNYEITWEQAAPLFARYEPEDPRRQANDEAWAAVADVALGRAKKATGATSGPP